jgi:hypothetical protein
MVVVFSGTWMEGGFVLEPIGSGSKSLNFRVMTVTGEKEFKPDLEIEQITRKSPN